MSPTRIAFVALLAALSSEAATPLPSLDARETLWLRQPTGSSKVVIGDPVPDEPLWRFGIHYFQGTSNDLGDLTSGSVDLIAQNGLRVSFARMLATDLWATPIDVLIEGGVMWHDEKDKQEDLFQYTLGLKFEWNEFPWGDHLRTRIGFTTGLSYVEHIPIAEQLNRGGSSSSHLLHYLDFTLAFNCGDIGRLTRLDRLFSGGNGASLDHVWLTVGIPHRSGAWGLYGNDSTGEPIQSGSNWFSIGIEADF